jgi:translation initiation factor 2B subunit (eIF-2B alpha/beta/delta family)
LCASASATRSTFVEYAARQSVIVASGFPAETGQAMVEQ